MPYPAHRRADTERSCRAVPPRRRGGVFTPVAPALTALGLLLVTLPGHGHGAEAMAAAPGPGGESALAAPSAVADRFEILLAEIEAGVRDLRLRADAGAELKLQLDAAERRTAELRAALDEARAAEAALRQACEAAEARVRELSKRLDASEDQGADLRAALGAAEARIAQLTAQRDDASRRTDELTNELDQALTEAAWIDRELEAAWQAAEARTAAVEEAQAARAAAEAELAKVRREADARATDLTDRLAASTAEAELLRSRLRAAEARLKRLHTSLIAGDRSAAQTAPEPEPLEEGSAEPLVVETPPPSPHVQTAALVAEPRTGALNALTVRPEPPRRSPPELAALDTRRTERGLAMIVPGDRLFRFDSDEIHPEAGDALARIGRVLEHYRDRNVLIVGHTDSIGDPAYNQDLSERRARSVREYFVGAFDLDPRRIRTAGQGASNPIASNATPLGRRQNRRVEVLVLN